MVHDDELSEPETTTLRIRDMVARGRVPRPPEHIYRRILAECRPGRGPVAIWQALRREHVTLESVVYVLEEQRKASDRRP
ncbi:hypothetical protein [Amycolatopsis plumensis]|uniref:Uncharacterized protein n=1 Tax=Amycolatopsis plumensis TaxID=236508 RepID=A0ABV5U966_9PSEU